MAATAQRLVTRLTGTATRAFETSKPYARLAWKYARVEMAPPSMTEVTQAQQKALLMVKNVKTGGWKQLTVSEVGVNAVIGLEIVMWFFVGEVIGKRSLLGYQIPGILNNHVELVTNVSGSIE